MVSPSIEKTVIKVIDDSVNNTSVVVTDTIWEKLPNFVANSAEKAGVTKETLSGKLITGNSSAQIAENIAEDVFAPVATTVIKYIVTVLIFVVLLIVVKFLARLLNSIFKKSLLGGANALLGGVLGAIKGVIYAILFCLLVSLITNITKDNFFITNEMIENSTVFKFVLNLIPFKF